MSSSLVEEAYFEAWGKAGGPGRVRRAFSLSKSIWRVLECQVRNKHAGASDADVARLTASRLYFSNPGTRQLLEGVRDESMIGDSDFQETTARIVEMLSDLGLKFHVTGGLVAAYYGDPRSTQDVDIVIDLSPDRPETQILLDRLAARYLINREVATVAIAQQGMFQAIDQQSMIKIDFHVGGRIPGELERSTLRELAPGLLAPIVAKEDAIVSKLLWIKQGSHRGRHDVKEMLRREEFDRSNLEKLARELGVVDLLDELQSEVNAGWSPS